MGKVSSSAVTDKTGKEPPSYAFDNGTVIGIFTDKSDDKFNVVLNNRATINKNGAMQLIMPDEYYPGVDRVKDSTGRYQVDKVKRAKAEKAESPNCPVKRTLSWYSCRPLGRNGGRICQNPARV